MFVVLLFVLTKSFFIGVQETFRRKDEEERGLFVNGRKTGMSK